MFSNIGEEAEERSKKLKEDSNTIIHVTSENKGHKKPVSFYKFNHTKIDLKKLYIAYGSKGYSDAERLIMKIQALKPIVNE